MDIKEFRESGLLELYLMGACSQEEIQLVEESLAKFPELQKDIEEISLGLANYAHAQGKKPSPSLKDKILKEAGGAKKNTNDKNAQRGSGSSSTLTTLLSAATILLAGFGIYFNNEMKVAKKALEAKQIECDSILTATQLEYAMLDDLQRSDNALIAISATEKYAGTELVLIHNATTRKNYLQVQNLPAITANQSFQLWSLKPDQAPIPLTVFQGDEGIFIPIDFEEGTPTYAITIEPRGGQDAPTLANLIGTWGV